VPGILATSRPLKRPVVRLKDLAAALVAEFGIEDFPPVAPAKTAGAPSPVVTLSEAKGLGDPSVAARPAKKPDGEILPSHGIGLGQDDGADRFLTRRPVPPVRTHDDRAVRR
jgi:hypothetical protein